MIRILHTADWHLGQTFFGYDRAEEQEHFLRWLAETVEKEAIDALLVSGDVFDVSNPAAAAQRMFYRFVRQIVSRNPALQLVLIAGNHDSAARLEAPVPLLEEMQTWVVGTIRREEGQIDYDRHIVELKNRQGAVEALCLAVPYLRQGDYPVVEGDGSSYATGVEAFYRELLEQAQRRQSAGQALVAMGHLYVTGSEIAEKEHSERVVIGGLEYVSPAAFSEALAYTALGHIHKAQRVGRESIRYAGSPLPMSFAEKNYKQGVALITLDDGQLAAIEKREYLPLTQLLSIPAAAPEAVLEALEQLPDLPDLPDGSMSRAPFLEVKVLFDAPEPMFRQQVEEIVSRKNVRLARIVPTYRSAAGDTPTAESLVGGLQAMNPLQIARTTFQHAYQSEMPDDLADLFQQACILLGQKDES